MIDERTEIILAILAQTDTVFAPCRGSGAIAHVVSERRALFHRAGIPWHAAGETRKAVSRKLADLKCGADVTTTNPSGSRTVAVKLTSTAESWARAFIGIPTLDDALLVVDRLYAMQDHPDGFHFHERDWLRETTLGACQYGDGIETGEKLVDLAEQLLPALVSGYVISACDISRHISYSLTTAGRRIAAERLVKVPIPASRPKPNLEAEAFYFDSREQAEQAIASCKPSGSNDTGPVPLSERPTTRGMIAARCGSAAKESFL